MNFSESQDVLEIVIHRSSERSRSWASPTKRGTMCLSCIVSKSFLTPGDRPRRPKKTFSIGVQWTGMNPTRYRKFHWDVPWSQRAGNKTVTHLQVHDLFSVGEKPVTVLYTHPHRRTGHLSISNSKHPTQSLDLLKHLMIPKSHHQWKRKIQIHQNLEKLEDIMCIHNLIGILRTGKTQNNFPTKWGGT